MTEQTDFVYSSGKLIAEYSTTPASQPSVNFTTTDHLGSPRVITNGLGQIKSRRDFMPFGEDVAFTVGSRSTNSEYAAGDDLRQKFTGYQKDEETSLDFAEARMYENRHGRFTAVDPLLASGKSANPQTFNRYIYVGNNPVTVTDPLGLDWFSQGNRFLWSQDNKVFDDGSSVDGWDAVQFGSNGYYAYNCEGCAPGQQAYLYQIGGWDNGLRAGVYDSLMRQSALANGFNDPEYLAVRNPQVRDAAADVMSSGAAILNKPSEAYNFGAGAVNFFGGNVPYAPTISPDDNTRAGGKFFYYGTNIGLVVQGGVSAYRSFATKPGQAVFWSGYPEAQKAAMSYASLTGRTTIETTKGGRVLNFISPAVRGVSKRADEFLWARASSSFARQASGSSSVFLRLPVNTSRNWFAIEQPILKARGIAVENFFVK